MVISEIYIENFRIFGSEKDGEHLRLQLNPGLNVLAGENDSGKSAIIDAIRYTLLTTSRETPWFTEDDFHLKGKQRATNITIRCLFQEISEREEHRFVEFLSIKDGKPCFYVTLRANRLESTGEKIRSHIYVTRHSGEKGDGPVIEGEVREFLRTTYLRPLRDAESELSAGKGSRLAQILSARPGCEAQSKCNIDTNDPSCEPKTLVEIMRRAEGLIESNEFIQSAKRNLNDEYLKDLSIGHSKLEGDLGIAKQAEIRQILEKLELWLKPEEGLEQRTQRGLGVNNVLFMATELLLLSEDEYLLPLVLIEEPEAHLHPQMQLRLMDFLEQKTKAKNVQIIITTHSPNLASKVDLEIVVIMCAGKAFPLRADQTKLEKSDYLFLRRFLDVTKANMFFAKGVVIVEGDAENILLPTLAKLLGESFTDYGVSIVKVGSRGLFRYSRIYQRKDSSGVPIKVACIVDRDIIPDSAKNYLDVGKRKLESQYDEGKKQEHIDRLLSNDGYPVKTFVSPKWTFEYDIALSDLALQMHTAIKLASKGGNLTEEAKKTVINDAKKEYEGWAKSKLTKEDISAKTYLDLHERRASKAETAQFLAELLETNPISAAELRKLLPDYIVKAIDYVTGNRDGRGS
jgi:putative ATP-dependent endonuclease of OLD family